MVKIGIIGGSGVDDPKILKDFEKKKMHTPYGAASDFVVTGKLNGVDVVIIPRHGEGHRFNPTNVNYRANIHVMNDLGVTHIIAPTACGSLKEEIKPGDLVFIDQFIDRTTKRDQTFYEGHLVCHISMAEPFCPELRELFFKAAKELGMACHNKGTLVTIEGPRFSTKAESSLYRSWDCDVINMTTVPECVLARELGMHYQPIAMSTDYDCWHETEEKVTVDMIMETLHQNAENVKKILAAVVPLIKDSEDGCTEGIKQATL